MLKLKVRILAEDTARATRTNVISPARYAAQKVGTYANNVIDKTKEQLGHQLAQVEESTSQSMERTGRWISANPLVGVGVAFAVGLLASTLLVSSKR